MLWLLCGALVLLLLGLSWIFGPGVDTHNARVLLPPSESETQFLKKHVAHGQEESGFFSRPRLGGRHKLKLFYRIWLPKSVEQTPLDVTNSVKGVVVALTGINGHSARNNRWMGEVLDAGFIVAGYDHEGMGRSDGRHGYFASAHELVDDAIAYVTMVRAKFPGQRVFLHGGSLGGLLILLVLAKIDRSLVDGAVILCPAVQIHAHSRPPYAVELLGRLLRSFAPKLPLARGNKGHNSSPEVAAAVDANKLADPLFYNGHLRVGTGFAMLEAIEYVQDQFQHIETPYLLQHGLNDLVCHVSGSEELHIKTRALDKTFKTYVGGAHDLSNEPPHIRDPVVQDFVAWLTERAQ